MSFKIDFDLFLSHINNYLFFNKNNLNRFGKVTPITYSKYDNENDKKNKNNENDENDENDENNKENKINKNEEDEIKINNDFLYDLYEKYKFNYDLETGLNDVELGQYGNR